MAPRMAGALRRSGFRHPAMSRRHVRRRTPGAAGCQIAPHRTRLRDAFPRTPMARRLSAMRPVRVRRSKAVKRVRGRPRASANAGHRLRISRHRPPTRTDGHMNSPKMMTVEARRRAVQRARREGVRQADAEPVHDSSGYSKSPSDERRLASPVQALPACVTRNEGSTPIFASTSVYFSSTRGSKTSSASPGQVSQPFAWISLSNCPGAQPA